MKMAAKSFGLEKSRMQKLVQMSLEPGTRSNVSEEIRASREGRKKGERRAGKDIQLVECVPSMCAASSSPAPCKCIYIPALRKV